MDKEERKNSKRPRGESPSDAVSASDRVFEQVKRELARHRERLADLRDQAAFVFGFSSAADQTAARPRGTAGIDADSIDCALRRAMDEKDDLQDEIDEAKRQSPRT